MIDHLPAGVYIASPLRKLSLIQISVEQMPLAKAMSRAKQVGIGLAKVPAQLTLLCSLNISLQTATLEVYVHVP
jgi:hypothetical protein